jgi:hypothetical protein
MINVTLMMIGLRRVSLRARFRNVARPFEMAFPVMVRIRLAS